MSTHQTSPSPTAPDPAGIVSEDVRLQRVAGFFGELPALEAVAA